MKTELCCIICPMSCQLHVKLKDDGTIDEITGNSCPRGATYARTEAIDPQRMLTTTIQIKNGKHSLLPVITSKSVSKSKLFDIMKVCKTLSVDMPIMVNDIIIKNIADSGADLIASKTMKR